MTWLGYKIYIFTVDEKLFTIRDTEPEKLPLIPGCLGNACEPQKLINIQSSEPWLLIEKSVVYPSCRDID